MIEKGGQKGIHILHLQHIDKNLRKNKLHFYEFIII